MTLDPELPINGPGELPSNRSSRVANPSLLSSTSVRGVPRRARFRRFGLHLARLVLLASFAHLFPGASSAAVTDLLVEESGQDALLTWSTGTPPFRVLRSESPSFYFGNHLAAQELIAGAFTDPDAVEAGDPSYFYLVLENGESDPPGFVANPPRPVPFITSLTPDARSPGDVVTIEGGNFEPDGAAMTVRFQDAIDSAEILTASATQLTVVVPDDALTGDVFVCWAGQCSNRVPFKVVLASGFQDISSIAFEAGTGGLWVADRGSADHVYEIDASGAVFTRGTLNQPLLGHPSPANGNGRIYYSNSLDAIGNLGTIEYVDSATNAEVLFDQAGVSGGNSTDVRCEGIAATDLEPNVAYFLDGRGNSIRRIVRNAFIHDLMYGDQPFTFNRPSGARFDSEGNLYISAVTSIYKILPQEEGVTLVASGFTAAAGIDLTEDTGIPMLLVADEATGVIWLVNGETGDKEIVDDGFSEPVGVAFSQDVVTEDLFYDVAEPTRILRLPDPRVEFVEKKDTHVLLSKRGTEPSYPSPNQMEDRRIQVTVKVTDKIDPAGSSIYFRLVDPKDRSRYLNGQPDDNLPASPAGTVTPTAIVDSNGFATVTLEVGPQYVGNNYEIEASLTPPPNFKKVARSKEYSSWRRLYIEHDRMYKAGEFLTQTSGAGQPDPERVFVANSATFSVNDEVHILSGDSIQHSDGEVGIVAAVDPVPGCQCVSLQSPLSLSYSAPQGNPPSPYSFLAKRSAGTFDVLPSVIKLSKAFDDGFTEWYLLADDGYVPYWEHAGNTPAERDVFIDPRTFLFFKNFDRGNGEPFINHVQLVSASRFEPSIPPPPASATLGLTSADNTSGTASNWAWIFDRTIEDFSAPGNVQSVRDHVTAHELGHELNVNQGDPGGHDNEQGWSPPGQPTLACLMKATTLDNTTANHRFHADPAAPTRDLLCIRTHVDDLNQDSCP